MTLKKVIEKVQKYPEQEGNKGVVYFVNELWNILSSLACLPRRTTKH